MKASDISDDEALAAVVATRGLVAPGWSMFSDVCARLTPFPYKVVRAKLASLIRRKKLLGCACGCRGDFEVPGSTGLDRRVP